MTTREPSSIERIEASLPPPLRAITLHALLAWAGLGAISIVVCLAIVLRSEQAVASLEEGTDGEIAPATSDHVAPSGTASGKAQPVGKRAPDAELSAAKLKGAETLAALAQKYPDDARVVRELFLARASDRASYAEALRAASHLFEVSKEAGKDDEVQRALATVAEGPPDAMNGAFSIMATKMGEFGPDLMFEITNSKTSSKAVKDRAQAMLADPDVKKITSPALVVLMDLRAAPFPCSRKPVLTRAKEFGDERALPYLTPMLTVGPCPKSGGSGGLKSFFRGGGSADCYACYGDRSELKAAIAAIEARTGKQAPIAPAASASSPASPAPDMPKNNLK